MYAEVAVNLAVKGTFHYHIPAELAGRLSPGHLVEVSFGTQKAQAVVLALSLHSPVSETKPVEALVDRKPVLNAQQLALARWMSQAYLAPLVHSIRLQIPPGLSRRGDVLVTPVIDPELIEPANDTQARLLRQLNSRGPLRGRQVARALPRRNWQDAVRDLVERGVALREPVLSRPVVSARQVRTVELGIALDRVEAVVGRQFDLETISTRRQEAARRRIAILRLLAETCEPLQVGEVYSQVEGASIADLRSLADDDLVVLGEMELWRDPLSDMHFTPQKAPRLTRHQMEAWEIIRAALEMPESPRPVLLHGVTGSGKTELYIRAVEEVINQGEQALVLVPEIALTPQTIRRFGARFVGRMGIVHSQMSMGERYDTWRRAREGQLDLVIGARSALFTPFDRLGVIVIDECHDDSYKQTPPIAPPYYHAVRTAEELARLHGALLLMGSATPNVATYSRTGEEAADKVMLVDLPARIMGHSQAIQSQALYFHVTNHRYSQLPGEPDEAVMIDLPPVKVVDMRQELRAGNRSIFSRKLSEELGETLQRSEQAILFLNRRGTATYVFCRDCGHVQTCPRCSTPLTWHTWTSSGQEGEGLLVCHHCNYRTQHPSVCPECGSNQIKFFGGGTERIEQEVMRQFPDARVLRWDRDTANTHLSHDALLESFVKHQADVLVGTQMIAKGLDIPLVTLVGVVSADTALYLPDYRSNERTFQLLTQVAGRAGRGLLGGQVIIQTYDPDHYAIRAASNHDFHAFCQTELRYRADLGYPPYSRLARVEVRATSTAAARSGAVSIYNLLAERIKEQRLTQTVLVGPVPCFYARVNRVYRWQVIVRGPDPVAALHGIEGSSHLIVDIDPVSLL
nr:primosomal protein N' [Anaerolineae bacterium]